MSMGKHILGRRHVFPSVASTLTLLQIEGTFTTGTHLVTVDQPVSTSDGDIKLALYGSFLPCPSEDTFPVWPEVEFEAAKAPGAIISAAKQKIELNPGRKRTRVRVTNRGDRPIQVLTLKALECEPLLTAIGWIAFPFHRDQSATRL